MSDESSSSLNPFTRRAFLANAGRGLVAATLAGELLPAAAAGPKEEKPIKLPEFKAKTEQEAGPVPDPLPPGGRVGFAVVGLGHLALNQILPALVTCKKSRLAALVSGSLDKGREVARQYGLAEKKRLRLQDLRPTARQQGRGCHLHRPAQWIARRIHRARCRSWQAYPVRKADGELVRRMPADDRRLQEGRQETHDRLPHPVRAAQPARAKNGCAKRRTARQKSSSPSTPRTTAPTNGGRTSSSPAAVACPTWVSTASTPRVFCSARSRPRFPA